MPSLIPHVAVHTIDFSKPTSVLAAQFGQLLNNVSIGPVPPLQQKLFSLDAQGLND